VTMPETGIFGGRDGVAFICLGTALPTPAYPGEVREVRDQLAARPQAEGNRGEEVSTHRFTSFSVDCSTPVPGMSGRTSAGRVCGTVSARSLSCPEYSSACGGTGWRLLSPPRPNPAGKPISTAHGGAGTGHLMLRIAVIIR
jgi:hypothetical protein